MLARDDIADFTVDTGGRTVPEIARFVLDQVPGWTNLAAACPLP